MLHVYFGEMDGIIYNTEVYFKNVYEDEWIVDSFNREMIRDVDSSEVLASGVIDSPVLGKIPPERLSGGVASCRIRCFMPRPAAIIVRRGCCVLPSTRTAR